MKKIIWVFSLVILATVISACGSDSSKKGNKAVSLDQYQKSFEKIIKKNKGNSAIELGKLEKIESERYSMPLTNSADISLFIDVDKDKNIKAAKVAATSRALENNNTELRIAFNSLLKSLDSNLSEEQQNATLKKLGFTDSTKLTDKTKVQNVDNITFTYYSKIENDSVILEGKYK